MRSVYAKLAENGIVNRIGTGKPVSKRHGSVRRHGDPTRDLDSQRGAGLFQRLALRAVFGRLAVFHEARGQRPESRAWFDGTTNKPKGEQRDTFVFDPDDPVPTLGGANFFYFPEFDGELLGRERYLVDRIPEHGTLQLVEPILTARTATIIAATFIISVDLIVEGIDPEETKP